MKSIHIERGGVRLHALDHGGTGKPILFLLHGAAAHAHWWDWLAPRFSDLFRPVAIDHRGHGDSDWAENYRFVDLPDDVMAWIDWAHSETGEAPALIGHSMGGVVALNLHERHTPDIRALVIVDAPLKTDARILKEVRAFSSRPSRPWASRELFVEKFQMIPTSGKANAEHISHVAGHSVRPVGDGTWILKTDRRFHATRPETDQRPGWRNVNAPVLLIVGELSDRLGPADLDWVRERVPHSRIEVIAGAHHHVYMDEPENFLAAVQPFLRDTLS